MSEFEFVESGDDRLFLSEEQTNAEGQAKRVAVIRTSDRASFRKCRRRWGWNSHLRGNLGPKTNASPLWLGSGFHFAMEDFYGTPRFVHPRDAFLAYVQATLKQDKNRVPADYEEQTDIALNMIDYYVNEWLPPRKRLATYIHNGVPQVEVNFRIQIPGDWTHFGWDEVVYSGTMDRIVIDEDGMLWVLDYKTAKSIVTSHLTTDSQITTYCWAASLLYDKPVAGFIYQQHRKDTPRVPEPLKSGKISTAEKQLVSRGRYKQALIKRYGSVEKAPTENIEYLNFLATKEEPDADPFVRRDRIFRNAHQCQAEGQKIMLEIEEMLNPDIALYPNPDRMQCGSCSFQGACISLDDGSDYQFELDYFHAPRDPEYDTWRKLIEYPENPVYTAVTEENVNG